MAALLIVFDKKDKERKAETSKKKHWCLNSSFYKMFFQWNHLFCVFVLILKDLNSAHTRFIEKNSVDESSATFI